MLPAASPPDPAALDALLALLSVDAPLAHVQAHFALSFPGTVATLQAAASCHHLLRPSTPSDSSCLAPLRPAHRLAALWVMFHVGRAEPPGTTSDPSALLAWHVEQLRHNAFLEPIMQILDGWTDKGDATCAHLPASALTPQQRTERVFLTRLLLADYSRPTPLSTLSQLSRLTPAACLESCSATPVHSLLDDPPALQRALEPYRRIVRDSQPHPALMELFQMINADAGIHAQMQVPVASVANVLGEEALAALRAASDAAAAAASTAASSTSAVAVAASPSSSSSTVPLHVQCAPPHWYGAPVSDLDWVGASGWESLLHDPAGDPAPPLPPEMGWMAWDPPANTDWAAAAAGQGRAANSSALTLLSLPTSPTNAGTSLTSLLTKACKSQLLAADKSEVLKALKSCEPPAAEITGAVSPHSASVATALPVPTPLLTALQAIPPARLPLLVEKNHDIAIELLRQLLLCHQHRAMLGASSSSSSSSSPLLPSVNSYLSPLVQMDLSLPSMEVAQALSVVVPPNPPLLLPPDFLHLYVCKCMASCARPAQDKYVQHRHVRLVCAFITTLIRKKLIQLTPGNGSNGNKKTHTEGAASAGAASSSSSPSSASLSAAAADARGDALLVEVSSFLVEFASHKEAAALYKLVKSLESK